jgi:hypothetical protein
MKKEMIILFVLLSFVFFVPLICAVDTHDANEILITLNGFKMTLQEAIDNKFLVDEIALPTRHYTSSVNPGHTADEIIISINGQVKTLQEAINGATLQNKGLCSSSGNPSNKPSIGHLSTDVKISSTETLQQSINAGKFCDQYTYSWNSNDPSWTGACSVSCGAGTQTRIVWCERSDTAKTHVADNYCVGAGIKHSSTNPCDAGSNICGWSGFTQTGTCSKNCGTGNLQRIRTCNIAGHCVGNTYDWNGASCYRDTTCNYQYITLQSRITDSSSQCTNYWWKHWWWEKAGNDYWDPCINKLGSSWSVSSVSPRYGSGNLYWCDVTCQKKLPSVSQYFSVSVPRYEQINQCLDYGWKTMWSMSCPSDYKSVQYQLKSYINYRTTCQTLCVRENTA